MDDFSFWSFFLIFTWTILVGASPSFMVRARKRRQAEVLETQQLVDEFEGLIASAKKQTTRKN